MERPKSTRRQDVIDYRSVRSISGNDPNVLVSSNTNGVPQTVTDESTPRGWFEDLEPGDLAAARDAIELGRADDPQAWPKRAVETGFAADEDEYYDRLHEATMAATRTAVRERESAPDRQLVHAVRAMDDTARVANELAERVAEWAGSRFEDADVGLEYARELATGAEDIDTDPLVSLAGRVRDLDDERRRLRTHVEKTAPGVAPNLSTLAGPVLAARLIALAGGLEDLAKMPSGTIQVLGAEEALFAHLRGHAPSPKHGVIFTHDAIQGTSRENRGSAARALAGKLAIAARIDHYSGEPNPDIEAELVERIQRIRGRDAA